MGRRRLTIAQRVALDRAADESGGVAGSEWYSAEKLGGRRVASALNRIGMLEPQASIGAGMLYRLTDLGRDALKDPTIAARALDKRAAP